MQPDQKPSQPTVKKAWYTILAIYLTVMLIVAIFNIKQVNRIFMRTNERNEDTTGYTSTPLIQDTIRLADGNILRPKFESDYSATMWYQKFKLNKVAFGKKYKDKRIDVFGTITAIKTDGDCATMEVQAGDSAFNIISFGNCGEGIDGWSDEVAKVTVGENVHVRGKYGEFFSSDYTLELYDCHIIQP